MLVQKFVSLNKQCGIYYFYQVLLFKFQLFYN